MGLLMDGEVAIQPEGSEQPFIYRGFQMIDEAKFRDLRGDELRKMNQNGTLGAGHGASVLAGAGARHLRAPRQRRAAGREGFNPPAAAAPRRRRHGDAANGSADGEPAKA